MSPVPTLQQLIEEEDVRRAVCRIYIGGALLPKWSSVTYQFAIGQVPTATIVIPGAKYVPGAVAEEASVEIWFGFSSGMVQLDKLVFGGAVVDSIGVNGRDVIIECVMDGPRKLSYGYNRTIGFDFTVVEAAVAVAALLDLAGVANYAVNLDPWVIGTAVPQTIQFSTYGEAINKVAEVDGSPWYAMPTGQVRVERRDPIPSPTAHRTYFTGVLTGSIESQPIGITNTAARPRILDIQRREFRAEVANYIEVDGAVLVTLGPNGEQNSDQIVEFVDGASGQFPNGAYWIPTPPLFQDFTFSNELIDTNAKAFEVAERYFGLKNRLFQKVPISVPGDPDVFLGETVELIDPGHAVVFQSGPSFSSFSELYFVEGYRTTIDESNVITELSLTGGPESGTTGFASPFAEFIWKYSAVHHITGGERYNNGKLDLGPGADMGSKLCMDLAADTGSTDLGGGLAPGFDAPMVFIGFDGTPSEDFDGHVVSWAWSDDNGHTGTGSRITIAYDPDAVSSIQMTLVVTDDTGRTDTITKTVFTSADHNNTPGESDPPIDDTPQGGGVASGPCTDGGTDGQHAGGDGTGGTSGGGSIGKGGCNGMAMGLVVAAGAFAMGSADNRIWNDLDQATAGVAGNFISVGAVWDNGLGKMISIFGTDAGEVVLSDDLCLTGSLVASLGGRIETIWADTDNVGHKRIDAMSAPVTGVLSIEETYRICLDVGFSDISGVIATAIMIAESSLDTAAVNVNPGPPVSTDRGIAQINNVYHPEVTDACAYEATCAIKAMFAISSGGTDFSPWSTFVAGSYKDNLATVQAAIGIDIGDVPSDSGEGSISSVVQPEMKCWIGTSDGRIFISNTSGRTWELWIDFGDGLPIYGFANLPFGDGLSGLWVFGGNTGDIQSLVRIHPDKNGNYASLPISGALKDAIETAGAGFSCRGVRNETGLALGFSGGVSPAIWFSQNPIGDQESWTPSIGAPASIKTMASAFGGGLVVA